MVASSPQLHTDTAVTAACLGDGGRFTASAGPQRWLRPGRRRRGTELPPEEEADGRKAILLPGDITDQAFCKHLVEQASRQLGGLDILVNNAGKQTNQSDITAEQFDRTLKTNLYALFWISKAAVPHMPPGASIVNTTSVVAYKAPEILLDYATTKAGIITFTAKVPNGPTICRGSTRQVGAGKRADTGLYHRTDDLAIGSTDKERTPWAPWISTPSTS